MSNATLAHAPTPTDEQIDQRDSSILRHDSPGLATLGADMIRWFFIAASLLAAAPVCAQTTNPSNEHVEKKEPDLTRPR
jgi:hypothetical protein